MIAITLLYDELEKDTVDEKIAPEFGHNLKMLLAFKTDLKIELGENELFVTYLSDEQLKEFLPIAIEKGWKLGFLPHPKMIHAVAGFGIDSKLKTAIDTILEEKNTVKVDLLMA
ncbi:MAG TPA: hypothetical protein VK921_04460, partial [Anditalea sp.]|nr:hypothetical protein [Anditalea sp.]